MKDIGYYAGFLTDSAKQKITEASIYQLQDLLYDLSESIYLEDRPEEGYMCLEGLGWEDVSGRDRLALIREVCDRIEQKLMEQAK